VPFKGTRKNQVSMRGWGMNTRSTNLSTGLTCHSAEVASVVQRHTLLDSTGFRLTISFNGVAS
jgi:hypothetical protein